MKKQIIFFFIALFGFSFMAQAQTKSFKRGVGYNNLSMEDVEALSPGLSWGYNWGHTGSKNDAAFAEYGVDFVPMAWNGINKTTARNLLNAHPEIKYLLAFNEPNFREQANMSPTVAAARWPDIEEIAGEFGLTIVGPALNYSPDAPYQDPFKWYDEFFAACPDCRVDHIAVHLYMPSAGAIKSSIDQYKKYNRPIWLTEFCAWESSTTAQSQKRFLVEALDYLETEPAIFRYAWFKERGWNGGHPFMQLLTPTNGVLSELGEVFTHMSSYDDSYYFGIDRQIPAEHYIRMKGINLEKTTDESGHINICEFEGIEWVDYNVDIPATGEYNVFFRISAEYPDESEIKMSVNNVETGSLLFEKKGVGVWNTQQCRATFQAGKQKIRLGFKRGGLRLNWWAITQSEQVPTALEHVISAEPRVYPNPVENNLTIQSEQAYSSFSIFDLNGKKLYQGKDESTIDISSYEKGVYVLSLEFSSGKRGRYKILKK